VLNPEQVALMRLGRRGGPHRPLEGRRGWGFWLECPEGSGRLEPSPEWSRPAHRGRREGVPGAPRPRPSPSAGQRRRPRPAEPSLKPKGGVRGVRAWPSARFTVTRSKRDGLRDGLWPSFIRVKPASDGLLLPPPRIARRRLHLLGLGWLDGLGRVYAGWANLLLPWRLVRYGDHVPWHGGSS